MADRELADAQISPSAEPDPSVSPAEEPAAALEPQAGDEKPEEDGEEAPNPAADHKRKHDDLATKEDEQAAETSQEAKATAVDAPGVEAEKDSDGVESEAKRQRVEEGDGTVIGEQEREKLEASAIGNGQLSSTENTEQTSAEDAQKSDAAVFEQSGFPPSGQEPSQGAVTSRRIVVPSNKVGVLIGKAGETIRNLQNNSRAKIQITRDADADPNSATRPVELIGALENINKAEQLIKAVIAEADAGGSPSLVALGFDTTQTGAEQVEIQVPNEKVGLIIGKGGETIKTLQTRSGARIQLIPQHLPEGDASKERTVRVTGNKKQIEVARGLIKDVMDQVPIRPSPLSGGHSQQTFRPRGPVTQPQWGSRAPPQTQVGAGYDYQQRGMYASQGAQYQAQPYGGYSQQPPARSSYGTSWEQRPVASAAQSGGYDYYGQGGRPLDGQLPSSMPAPAPTSAAPPGNYNYGHSQAPVYGQPPPYGQSGPVQQGYGHGYDEPKYDGHAPNQQYYGQPPMGSQPGGYPQQMGVPQSGYGQQQSYGKPPYDVSAQATPQSYGPRPSHPGDPMFQGPTPTYGSGPPQSYPYGPSAPSQPAPAYGQPPYGPTSGTVDGYNQPSGGYPQHGGQTAPGYGQAPPAYAQQGAPPSGYGQYAPTQPIYGDQPAPNTANYSYQGGSSDGTYGNSVPNTGYGSAPAGAQAGYAQPGYGQPPSMQGYDQSGAPQPGYVAPPAGAGAPAAPAGYTKSLSPQPGYGGQYDSTAQMYGHH